MCNDYRKLNVVTRKDHFPLPFIDQVLERVPGHPFYCFLDCYSGYFQIEIDVEDKEKTTFTCPFGTYAYKRKPFETLLAMYGVKHKVATLYHPQTSGQVKLTNRKIKNILMKVVNTSKRDWFVKLHDSLWV